LGDLLAEEGLIFRGGFVLRPDEEIAGSDLGLGPRTLALVGNAGSAMWQRFSQSPEYSKPEDPLNHWSERVLTRIAAQLGARPLFPFGGPPYHPFVAWAKRAEDLRESPLGLLVHPEFGLWHAYRGALVFEEMLDLPARPTRPMPCDICADKPCLSACPVGAFRHWEEGGYDVAACAAHIDSAEGGACLDGGCLARHACPVGQGFTYDPQQARFHMDAFLRARMGETREK
jgi:hypothetical protein